MTLYIRCKDTDNVIGLKEDIAMRLETVAEVKHIEIGDDIILAKAFYTDYVRHMARFYFRSNLGIRQNFKTVVDAENWKSCHNAAKGYDKNLLLYVYEPKDDIENNVKVASNMFGIPVMSLWNTIERFEETVARKRGLI